MPDPQEKPRKKSGKERRRRSTRESKAATLLAATKSFDKSLDKKEKSYDQSRSRMKSKTPQAQAQTPLPLDQSLDSQNKTIEKSASLINVSATMIELLKTELKSQKLQPQMSDLELKRWLIQKKCNIKNTAEAIQKHLEWRKEFGVDEIIKEPPDQEIQMQIDSGIFKIFPDSSLDPDGRPIVICIPINYIKHCGVGKVDTKKFIVYYQEKMTNILNRLNSQDFVVFLDVKGCKMKHIDYTLAKQIGEMNRTNYPERLGRVYVVNYPYFYHVIWMVVKAWISKKTQSKIKFLDSKKIDINAALETLKIPDDFQWK